MVDTRSVGEGVIILGVLVMVAVLSGCKDGGVSLLIKRLVATVEEMLLYVFSIESSLEVCNDKAHQHNKNILHVNNHPQSPIMLIILEPTQRQV